MGRHGSRRADLVSKQEGGKAHARGNGNYDKAADGGAVEMGPPSPGQHPSLQLVQVPAHADSSFACPSMLVPAPNLGGYELSGASPPRDGPQTRQERRTAALERFPHPTTGQEASSPQSRPKPRGGSSSRPDRSRSHTARSASAVGVSARLSGKASSHCW